MLIHPQTGLLTSENAIAPQTSKFGLSLRPAKQHNSPPISPAASGSKTYPRAPLTPPRNSVARVTVGSVSTTKVYPRDTLHTFPLEDHLEEEAVSPPGQFSWQAMKARRARKGAAHHEALYSGQQRTSRSALPRPREFLIGQQLAIDTFEDEEHPAPVESELSGSDGEYIPEGSAPPHDIAPSEQESNSPATPALTAKEKGKARDVANTICPDDVSCHDDARAKSTHGRLSKATIASFKSFGDLTRLRAQELADIHGINLATVLRHASLGAGSESRAPNDCNTFKSIYSAELFASSGGMFIFMFVTIIFTHTA